MDMPASVLLVEDEPLIAMLIEDILDDTEFVSIATHRCNKDALLWLAENRPDLAVIDCTLLDGLCLPVIEVLKKTGVPFVVASGHVPGHIPELAGHPYIAKPFRAKDLLVSLREVMATAT